MARQQGSWRPGDAQLGWIVENRIDEAYVLSWPGPLEIYVPVHDTGGFDRARAPMGTYDFRLDQIKGTASLHSGNEVRISFDAPALRPRKGLDFTFAYYDLPTREVLDPLWKVPSVELDRVCDRDLGHRNIIYHFVANRSGSARDRAAKYQIGLSELAGSRGWSVLPASPVSVSRQPVEANTFFLRHFDAAFLEAATGDEVLMSAQPDTFDRHRLAFSKSTGLWASLAIHGGTIASETDLIQANIHRATFSPHRCHYILIQHYDGRRREWYPWSWLIRSTDFVKLAREAGPYLLFTTTLNPDHVNRWTPFRTLTTDVASKFLAALHQSASRRAA
ncbi:MAG TPA: hypothetical protein VFR68_04600 [Candidatus Dormibacteraeota bacterium]|nr:hypothetical protein [Candidatus Dormibacteraeota bacterium]